MSFVEVIARKREGQALGRHQGKVVFVAGVEPGLVPLDAAGLPYLTISGRGFYDRPEIRDLVNALLRYQDESGMWYQVVDRGDDERNRVGDPPLRPQLVLSCRVSDLCD